ncbi:diacylglycerol kinase [Candidatus Uhrbacteria bacterium]|nr:diacylglycerol kinase [Candidatus Uhrbacteria bacterium]
MSVFSSLARSFGHAFRGLTLAFKSERSFRLQVLAAFVVLVVIIVLPLELWERAILLLVTMFVLVLELLNSSLERLVDLAKPRLHAYAGDIKDLMAGSVLVAAIFALVLGLLILGPKFVDLAMRL